MILQLNYLVSKVVSHLKPVHLPEPLMSKSDARQRIREIAAEFRERGDDLGWFEAVYREAGDDPSRLPWGDLEPNRFFRAWAEKRDLKGEGRRALVVGCGLGDDARYLDSLGFEVTAFDISPTAIEWAKRLGADTKIQFETANLFEPFRGWLNGFDFVLEVYTIQPLPIELREKAIDAVASFLAPGGRLVVVCRGRGDDEEVEELPWPLSRRDLSRFEADGLIELGFDDFIDDEETRRFVVEYERPVDGD
jgi:SAM-dependent methyltransferase